MARKRGKKGSTGNPCFRGGGGGKEGGGVRTTTVSNWSIGEGEKKGEEGQTAEHAAAEHVDQGEEGRKEAFQAVGVDEKKKKKKGESRPIVNQQPPFQGRNFFKTLPYFSRKAGNVLFTLPSLFFSPF